MEDARMEDGYKKDDNHDEREKIWWNKLVKSKYRSVILVYYTDLIVKIACTTSGGCGNGKMW